MRPVFLEGWCIGFGVRASGREVSGAQDRIPGRSLLDLIAMEQELEQSLGIHVDVLTPGSTSLYLRDVILREAVPL
ncbi:MAG: hypothetical protein ABI718_15685 [Acidobacteriota bacterium]